MEKEFVPYQIALDMKELGFNEPCLKNYNGNATLLDLSESIIYKTKAPLYQQCWRWFREKYDLDSHIKKDWTDGVFYGYEAIIECVDGFIDVGTFKTYEQAETECLIKLIEIVKEQKL
jgi:hypothetical protein